MPLLRQPIPVILATTLWLSTPAQACLSLIASETIVTLTSADLTQPHTRPVTAGGPISLQTCGYSGIASVGYITERPTLSVILDGVTGPLQISADANSCDTLLVTNDPTGLFASNDDHGDTLAPRLDIAVQPGRLDIWVGTFGPDSCATTLTLQ